MTDPKPNTDMTEAVTNPSYEILPEGNIGNITIAKYNHAPFLQKTYCMITHCDKKVAKWTDDGNMFVIMNIEKFEKEIIPQYFDHKKFSSFTRQLNFYGFTKVQNILIPDFYDENKAYETFYNENFKRNRADLLCNIKRRTKTQVGKNQRLVEQLEVKVTTLNHKVDSLKAKLGQVNILKARLSSLEKFMLKEGYVIDDYEYQIPRGMPIDPWLQKIMLKPYQVLDGMKVGSECETISTIDPSADLYSSRELNEDDEVFDEELFDDSLDAFAKSY